MYRARISTFLGCQRAAEGSCHGVQVIYIRWARGVAAADDSVRTHGLLFVEIRSAAILRYKGTEAVGMTLSEKQLVKKLLKTWF